MEASWEEELEDVDVGIDDTDWIPIGEAARRAAVDPKTIRRWADKGLVRARRTLGGHRQIALSSMKKHIQQATASGQSQPNITSPVVVQQQPDRLIPELVHASSTWSKWKPPRSIGDDQLAALRHDVADLIDSLHDIEETVRQELRRRDDAAIERTETATGPLRNTPPTLDFSAYD